MQGLAEVLEHFYNQMLDIAANSPAEAIAWGANYDDTITYAPYFEKEILPWLQKVTDALHAKGKVVNTHCNPKESAWQLVSSSMTFILYTAWKRGFHKWTQSPNRP